VNAVAEVAGFSDRAATRAVDMLRAVALGAVCAAAWGLWGIAIAVGIQVVIVALAVLWGLLRG
jgi:hypothetical protein